MAKRAGKHVEGEKGYIALGTFNEGRAEQKRNQNIPA